MECHNERVASRAKGGFEGMMDICYIIGIIKSMIEEDADEALESMPTQSRRENFNCPEMFPTTPKTSSMPDFSGCS